MKKHLFFSVLSVLLGLLLPQGSSAQGSIPFTVANNSPFSDSDLYVAIVGIDKAGRHVWINAQNSAVLPISTQWAWSFSALATRSGWAS